MKLKYEGMTATPQYLTVYVTVDTGTWMQFQEVKVPLTQLLDPRITECIDTAVRRQLIEHWSGVDIADPLF